MIDNENEIGPLQILWNNQEVSELGLFLSTV